MPENNYIIDVIRLFAKKVEFTEKSRMRGSVRQIYREIWGLQSFPPIFPTTLDAELSFRQSQSLLFNRCKVSGDEGNGIKIVGLYCLWVADVPTSNMELVAPDLKM